MVAADRNLRLAGYEVYRFGGFELHEPTACDSFFRKLFQKHGLWNSPGSDAHEFSRWTAKGQEAA